MPGTARLGAPGSPAGPGLPPTITGEVRYGLCWEDPDVLRAALAVRAGSTVLSISSAGDNTLALLLDDPGRVVALDRNPAQIACLALRIAAFRRLDGPAEVLALLGLRPHVDRGRLYDAVRPDLPVPVRAWWDARRGVVEAGRAAHGRLEGYFETFRRRVLPLVHGRATVEALLVPRSAEARRRFYDDVWDTWRWRAVFRVFFSQSVMSRLGRGRECFAHVGTGGIAGALRGRAEDAVTRLDPSCNPFLHLLLTGAIPDAALPALYRPEHFETVRARTDRVALVCDDLAAHLAASPGAYAAANLSDVFEYLSEAESAALSGHVARALGTGGRVAYWNLFVPRRRPTALADALVPLDEPAAALHARDRAFVYARLVVEARTAAPVETPASSAAMAETA